ncbi:MAG: lysine--tRNA ligase, partial [Nitrosopumilus sp. H8]
MSVIGRGTWIDKLARELLEREEQLGRSLDMIRVESGLGASGIPHIGSLGDAVRAYGVKLALQDAGYKSELIAYSDDLDGLRKIPEGMPDSLKEHLAKPVSLIPDPYGCHDSYGMHMSSILLEGLDRVGVKYEFRRAADTYKKGLLSEQIHTILQNSAKI